MTMSVDYGDTIPAHAADKRIVISVARSSRHPCTKGEIAYAAAFIVGFARWRVSRCSISARELTAIA
jgi:hypothetical protein